MLTISSSTMTSMAIRKGGGSSARHGGEEFAVLMPDADHEVALKIGQRLRDSISRSRLTHGAPEAGALVTISIGVATQVPQEEETAWSPLTRLWLRSEPASQ